MVLRVWSLYRGSGGYRRIIIVIIINRGITAVVFERLMGVLGRARRPESEGRQQQNPEPVPFHEND